MECKCRWCGSRNCGRKELIDTLWNVNAVDAKQINMILGINRYIMECKCVLVSTEVQNNGGINRYIMECK